MAKKKINKKNKNLVLFLIIGGLLLLASVFALQNKQTVGSRASSKRDCPSNLGGTNKICCPAKFPAPNGRRCRSGADHCVSGVCKPKNSPDGKKTAPPSQGKPTVGQGQVCFLNGQTVANCASGLTCNGDNDVGYCNPQPAGKQ